MRQKRSGRDGEMVVRGIIDGKWEERIRQKRRRRRSPKKEEMRAKQKKKVKRKKGSESERGWMDNGSGNK